MRLIDADEFLKAFENADADVCEEYPDCYCEWGFSQKAVLDLVQNIPTIDAVVLPCKVGDTVYQVDANRIYPVTIKRLIYDAGYIGFGEKAFGKTVFLTREEAEAALAKMDGGNEDG